MSFITMSLKGSENLENKLDKLGRVGARKVLSKALRDEAKRAKKRIIRNVSGLGRPTGTLLRAFKGAKVKSQAKKRTTVRIGVDWPTREKFGISPADPYFWPAAVEYGHPNAAPHPYLRPAIDGHKTQSERDIGSDVGRLITQQALKR